MHSRISKLRGSKWTIFVVLGSLVRFHFYLPFCSYSFVCFCAFLSPFLSFFLWDFWIWNPFGSHIFSSHYLIFATSHKSRWWVTPHGLFETLKKSGNCKAPMDRSRLLILKKKAVLFLSLLYCLYCGACPHTSWGRITSLIGIFRAAIWIMTYLGSFTFVCFSNNDDVLPPPT